MFQGLFIYFENLTFWNNLFVLELFDLHNYCEDTIVSSHMPHTHFPLLLTSYISLVHLSQLMNQY